MSSDMKRNNVDMSMEDEINKIPSKKVIFLEGKTEVLRLDL